MPLVYRAPMRSRREDVDSAFAVERALGDWRYDEHPDALAADLVHVRECVWMNHPVSDAEVPPAVVLTFARGGRNFQQIHEPAVGPDTESLWPEDLRQPSSPGHGRRSRRSRARPA
jgi:hypothetical protein